ncbi:hypothetical protein DKX38_020465 [Salix brachista]|uniref:Glycine-rich protein n=1 Tax=Salix brachista TaxID=2182728 RepID=A0A5N5K5H6_9ROSI|nr:hypothetical protein DKX38_020465 [Salix brachista]
MSMTLKNHTPPLDCRTLMVMQMSPITRLSWHASPNQAQSAGMPTPRTCFTAPTSLNGAVDFRVTRGMERQHVASWLLILLGFGLCSYVLAEAKKEGRLMRGKNFMDHEAKRVLGVKGGYRVSSGGYGAGSGSGYGQGGGQGGGSDKGYGPGNGEAGGYGSGGGGGGGTGTGTGNGNGMGQGSGFGVGWGGGFGGGSGSAGNGGGNGGSGYGGGIGGGGGGGGGGYDHNNVHITGSGSENRS